MSPLHETLACDQCYTTPCPHNPTQTNTDTRWHQLKTDLARDADTHQQLADDYSEADNNLQWDQANRHWGRAQALWDTINRMNQIEQETD